MTQPDYQRENLRILAFIVATAAAIALGLVVTFLGWRFLYTPQLDGACVISSAAGQGDHACTRAYRWFGM